MLVYRNRKLAVVEAKALDEELTEGVGQAKNYAAKLAVRYAYSTNGQGIYQVDMAYGIDGESGTDGPEGEIARYPTPDELGTMTFARANARRDRFSTVPFEDTVGVEELDQEKLTPLLRLKYHDSIADAVADLGKPDEIGDLFTGFQKYLYQPATAPA